MVQLPCKGSAEDNARLCATSAELCDSAVKRQLSLEIIF